MTKLCIKCEKRPARESKVECEHCSTLRNTAAQVRTVLRLENGLCIQCGSILDSRNKTRCTSCRKYHKNYLLKAKMETLEAYGGAQCTCCGETEFLFLGIDHINNDGAEHRRAIFNGNRSGNICLWLRRNGFPPGFQVTCMNCNMGKHLNGGICPHKKPYHLPTKEPL